MKLLLALLLLDVSGYVYAPDGSAVEGVVVRAGNASVKTGKDGGFVLEGLDGVVELDVDGKVKPLVIAGDLVSVTLADAGRSLSSSPSLHTRGEGTVRGTVTLDGKPLANAPVLVGRTRVVTNAKGEYVATGLAPEPQPIAIDPRLLPRVRRLPAKAGEGTVDLPLRSAPMVRGRVVDADGKPVARARVQLGRDFDPSPVRTAPDGRYALPVPAELDKTLVAVAVTPILHSTVRSKPFLLEDTGRTVDITLPKLETVRVRVADRAGKPIAGARVAFMTAAETVFPTARDIVDSPIETGAPLTTAEGELVLQLAPDTYHFAAAAAGFQTGSLSKTIAKAGPVDITLQREALLRGRVHRGGRGMEFVRVNIDGEDAPNAYATTDQEGKFELRGLAPGTYRLTISEGGASGEHTMTVKAPGDVELELPPPASLRGRVIDAATGTPVSNFMYIVDPVQGEPSNISHGTSSPDGTFTVELPAGSYRVTVQAEGFAASEPVEVHVAEDETTSVDFPLGRGITLTGRVLDEGRQPLGNAEVTISDAEPGPGNRQRARPRRSTTTAADGTFTLAGVEPGEARQLLVRRDGYLTHRRTLDVERATAVDVTLARGLSIHGIVMRGGRPVPGAQVEASSQAIGSERQAAASDGEGRFALSGLVSARYTVTAVRDDERTQVRDVDPAAKKEIVLSLGETPHGVIYGVVSGIPAGQPERLAVMAHSPEENAEGTIDATGRYRIENAPVGTVSVLAIVESAGAMRSSQRKQVELAAGQALRVDLDLGGNVPVRGRVTAGGQPVVAFVTFLGEDGRMATARTRDDGVYEVLLAAPGRHSVYARTDQLQNRTFETSREIRGGETIDIDLSEERSFEGTVVDAQTRQPIAGAFVAIAPPAMARIAATAETGADGKFRIVAPAAESLRLMVSAHGYAQQVVPLGGATTPVVFELSPAPETRIRVLDGRTGAPLEAQVAFSDEVGILAVLPRRSSDGTSYLFTVAPGRYRVMAYVKDHSIKTVEITAPGTMDIVME